MKAKSNADLVNSLTHVLSQEKTIKDVGKRAAGTVDSVISKLKNDKDNSKRKDKYSIDYVDLIEGMSDEAFAFFRNYLYETLSYRVLKLEDVRKMDMEESLFAFDALIASKDEVGKRQGVLGYYVSFVNKYLASMIQCQKDSHAMRYSNRLKEILKGIEKGKDSTEDINDIAVLFTCLFREAVETEKSRNKKLSAISLTLDRKDADLLRMILTEKGYGPLDRVEKNMNDMADKMLMNESIRKNARRLMYTVTMLFLVRNLDNQGIFVEEEGDSFDE